jgi:hypothetical protein
LKRKVLKTDHNKAECGEREQKPTMVDLIDHVPILLNKKKVKK